MEQPAPAEERAHDQNRSVKASASESAQRGRSSMPLVAMVYRPARRPSLPLKLLHELRASRARTDRSSARPGSSIAEPLCHLGALRRATLTGGSSPACSCSSSASSSAQLFVADEHDARSTISGRESPQVTRLVRAQSKIRACSKAAAYGDPLHHPHHRSPCNPHAVACSSRIMLINSRPALEQLQQHIMLSVAGASFCSSFPKYP